MSIISIKIWNWRFYDRIVDELNVYVDREIIKYQRETINNQMEISS